MDGALRYGGVGLQGLAREGELSGAPWAEAVMDQGAWEDGAGWTEGTDSVGAFQFASLHN